MIYQPHVQYLFLVYLVCDVLFLLLKYKGWEDETEEMTTRQRVEKKGEIKETRILIFLMLIMSIFKYLHVFSSR